MTNFGVILSCQQYQLQRCVPIVGEDDLHAVNSAVADLAARWRDLGVSLGLRSCSLEAFENSGSYSHYYLTEMLKLWLRQSYNVCNISDPHVSAMHCVCYSCIQFGDTGVCDQKKKIFFLNQPLKTCSAKKK